MGAHERSHTEAFFRKIKFWDDAAITEADIVEAAEQQDATKESVRTGDAPPVFLMPDGHTYFHVKRNGLIFGASSVRNVSPNTVLEVRVQFDSSATFTSPLSLEIYRIDLLCFSFFVAAVNYCSDIQGLLWNII